MSYIWKSQNNLFKVKSVSNYFSYTFGGKQEMSDIQVGVQDKQQKIKYWKKVITR